MTYKHLQQSILERLAPVVATAFLLGAPVLAVGPADGSDDGAPLGDERASYSFVRTLQGDATVAAAGQGVGEELEANQPLQTGDLVRVGPRSRLELALSDHNRLHLDAGSSLVLERMAFSGDSEDKITVLRLEEGELLIEVSDEALGDELPHVVTGNATVYFQEPGEYRIEADTGEWTRVVTRRGFAEIVTDRGSSIVRADEAILAQGNRWTSLELAAADAPDALERWSAELAERAQGSARSSRYVEPYLAYNAAPLDDAGDWIDVESVRYWRPHVAEGWRPYWEGRWAWTPSGYTWVSYEPWGWVPYHYGRWCSLPGYGWAWRPGGIYSPAWVYWNWTSGWAGWVPIGYYSQFYDPWYHDGFRFGVYGWAGGGWDIYSSWNFAPVHCFRDRNFRGHLRTGNDRRHDSGGTEPPRGLVTTDTRDFRPERIDRTEDLLHQIRTRHLPPAGGDLPDVTDFVGRKGKLPPAVARAVIRTDERPGGKERGAIRDVPELSDRLGARKVAETPAWQQRDRSGDEKRLRLPGGKESPTSAVGQTRKEIPEPSPGRFADKPHPATPRGLPPVDSRGTEGKARAPWTAPQEPGKKVYGPGGSSGTGQDQQRWKEKSGQSEPVQRVVGSVRRPAPGVEPKAPSSGYAKPAERSEPSERSEAWKRSPSSVPQTPRMSSPPPSSAPKYGGARTSAPPPPPPQVKSAPRTSSTVQRAQPPAKSPAASSGSKSSSRSGQSSPPPEKKPPGAV